MRVVEIRQTRRTRYCCKRTRRSSSSQSALPDRPTAQSPSSSTRHPFISSARQVGGVRGLRRIGECGDPHCSYTSLGGYSTAEPTEAQPIRPRPFIHACTGKRHPSAAPDGGTPASFHHHALPHSAPSLPAGSDLLAPFAFPGAILAVLDLNKVPRSRY